MGRKWVVNASPLIILGKISAIDLLEKMSSDLVIPEGVVAELHQGPDNDPARIWIRGQGISLVRHLDEVPTLIMAWDLGKGESEVIAWAHRILISRLSWTTERLETVRPRFKFVSEEHPRNYTSCEKSRSVASN